ncbi:alpha-amylase [Micromonospora endolithica]|uniref:Alpha-amylase n=1 Tax=Micromonospora endolithica TaxID=230091 RepID=A0A3A9ZTW6_9ACTN|nr:alpha-amylase family protein [Micromonospora endolithica]RKN51026.1 ATPase [Micromonospora endolithica]TWJ20177.1 alpha-amylase [Micromonospora endolithica]
MHRRRCLSAVVALGVIAGLLLPTVVTAPPAAAAPAGTKKVIANLFEWNWPSVASECQSTLGPKGYGYVQVSPPQEHVRRSEWWVAYQPVSYRIESRKGTRAQFKSMVDTCHAAGVKVIVDAVINHMSGQDNGGTGWAGSSYGHYNYPGIYSASDFHYCGTSGNEITSYGDRYQVQNCELVNLSDLKTESDYVRTRIAGYMNDLLSLGVDGFRLDASKHMPAGDIAAIKSKLSRSAYIVQEVIYGAGEPITPNEYTGNGDVHEFRYGKDLARVFRSEKLAYLRNFGEGWGHLPGSVSSVFVDNHDTQRDFGGVLTYKDRGIYALANVFMLAWPYGSPSVMSSYTFSQRDQGPPQDGSGKTVNTTCYSGWECEHRWGAIANMVGFRNATEGAGVVNWYDNGNNHIAFGRSGKGFVTVNDEDYAINGRSYYAGLPAGRYCDVVHGTFSGGSCSGPVITVDGNGWFAANIPAHDAVAIHVGARLS